jgi:hypothetical protein
MPRRSLTTATLALALTAALGGCASTSPTASAPLATPIATIAEGHGVRVALAIDRDHLEAGQPLRARLQVTNFEAGSVFWQGGGCDLMNGLSVEGPPPPRVDTGRTWPGEAGVLKSVTVTGTSPLGFMSPEVLAQPDVVFGCPANLGVNELKSGATTFVDAIWPATTELKLPVPGGTYVVKGSFPFLARLAAGPFNGDPSSGIERIDVEARVEVASPPDVISPYAAVDAILADARFSTWLATVPRPRWLESRLRYGAGTWTLTLRLDSPAQRGIVSVDARSGAVGELRVVAGS